MTNSNEEVVMTTVKLTDDPTIVTVEQANANLYNIALILNAISIYVTNDITVKYQVNCYRVECGGNLICDDLRCNYLNADGNVSSSSVNVSDLVVRGTLRSNDDVEARIIHNSGSILAERIMCSSTIENCTSIESDRILAHKIKHVDKLTAGELQCTSIEDVKTVGCRSLTSLHSIDVGELVSDYIYVQGNIDCPHIRSEHIIAVINKDKPGDISVKNNDEKEAIKNAVVIGNVNTCLEELSNYIFELQSDTLIAMPKDDDLEISYADYKQWEKTVATSDVTTTTKTN